MIVIEPMITIVYQSLDSYIKLNINKLAIIINSILEYKTQNFGIEFDMIFKEYLATQLHENTPLIRLKFNLLLSNGSRI